MCSCAGYLSFLKVSFNFSFLSSACNRYIKALQRFWADSVMVLGVNSVFQFTVWSEWVIVSRHICTHLSAVFSGDVFFCWSLAPTWCSRWFVSLDHLGRLHWKLHREGQVLSKKTIWQVTGWTICPSCDVAGEHQRGRKKNNNNRQRSEEVCRRFFAKEMCSCSLSE